MKNAITFQLTVLACVILLFIEALLIVNSNINSPVVITQQPPIVQKIEPVAPMLPCHPAAQSSTLVRKVKHPQLHVTAVKYDEKVARIKINKMALLTLRQNNAIKVRLNVGYCSYDGEPDGDGTVTIRPEWTPPGGRITVGVYDADHGKFLSSMEVKR